MSAQARTPPVTVPRLRARKGGDPIVCLTAYTAQMAALLDPHVDLLLVGDSVGMVMHGLPSTVGVTLEMMALHGAAVMRGAKRSCVVVDLPFGSYEESPEQAHASAVHLMKVTGCAAVKLEGGVAMAETIAFLTRRGVPVLAHVGLTPQAVHTLGGYSARGRTRAEWEGILDDARAIAEAGAFAVVIEAVSEPLAARITREIPIPTIGIGASAACDGQILVIDDLLGMSVRTPSFVRRYAELGETIATVAERYATDVRNRAFPGAENVYAMKE